MDKFFGNIYANSKQTSVQARLRTVSTNLETTGIVASQVTASYWRQGNVPIQFSVTQLPSIQTMWVNGGWKEVSSTLNPGLYRLDIPDESVAEGADWVVITVVVAGCYVFEERYNLQLKNSASLTDGILDSGFNDTYISVSGADNYFNTKLNTTVWDDSSIVDKTKALQQATRMIDRLLFDGTKTDPNQSLEFPRTPDITVPDDIKIANAEIAFSLLDGIDVEQEKLKLTKLSDTYDSVKNVYSHMAFVPQWLNAGIPSSVAWDYLKPYLLDERSLTLSRVS